MLYDYHCNSCDWGGVDEAYVRTGLHHPTRVCPRCRSILVRCIHHVTLQRGLSFDFQPHFNQTVGMNVSSLREFREKLKIRGEEETLATGIQHDYDVVDPRDRDFYKISDVDYESNEAINRGHRLDAPSPDVHTGEAEWGDPEVLEGDAVLDGEEIR